MLRSQLWLAFVTHVMFVLDSAALVRLGWPGAAFPNVERLVEHFCPTSSCRASNFNGNSTFICPPPNHTVCSKSWLVRGLLLFASFRRELCILSLNLCLPTVIFGYRNHSGLYSDVGTETQTLPRHCETRKGEPPGTETLATENPAC